MRALVGSLSFVAVACAADAPHATGEVGQWVAAPAMPTPRANHCTAAIDNWVIVIGGNHKDAATGMFVATDEIHVAQLDALGVLGPWQLAGHTPSAVTECTATADGRHLYIIDGIYARDTDRGQVWTADLDTTGTLGPLTSMGVLPEGLYALSSGAAVRDQELFVMNTRIPTDTTPNGFTYTLHTPLSPMQWDGDDWGIGFRSQSEFAFGDHYVYTIGGYHDPAAGAVTDVFVAELGATAATPSTPLPSAVGWGEAELVDNWLFVAGGRAQTFGAGGSTTVYAAQVAADGGVGAWTTATDLPMARTNHKLATVGDYLVLTGGAGSGPGDDQAFVAQIRW